MTFDGIQFVLVLTGTLLLLFAVLRARRSRAHLGVALLILLGVPATVWQIEIRRPVRLEEDEVGNRPVQVREYNYVSSKTCQACHPERYATWFGSYHRTMTQVATPETVIGAFDGKEREVYGEKFRLGRENDEFYIEFNDPLGEDGAVKVRKPIVMTTGSHHMQAYWYATGENRTIALAPLVYLKADERWIPERSSFLKPAVVSLPDTRGLWNRGCQQCHATAPQPRLKGMDTKVAELGIACEACHGPGEEHVLANQDPRRRYRYHGKDEPDPTIVNPVRLSADRQSEVCGQCHSLWEAVNDRELLNSARHGFSYRPGDSLIKSKFVYHGANLGGKRMRATVAEVQYYVGDRFWSDGMLRVAGREFTSQLDTPCYNHGDPGKARLTCLHCHAMHQPADDPRPLEVWADDQLKPGMRSNQACLPCHSDIGGDNLEKHTNHSPSSTGSLCYNCHMPYTSYALLKAIRSHTIDVPSVAASVETGRPNACNQCHLDRTLGWAADHLQKWYGIQRPRLSEDQESVAAAPLWVLTGDAGQRAIMAWSMGWEAAQKASKPDWMIPFLGQLLVDPYDAVRYIAGRSLRTMPDCADFLYDFMRTEDHREAAFARTIITFRQRRQRTSGRHLLIYESGQIDTNRWDELLRKRNTQRVSLEE